MRPSPFEIASKRLCLLHHHLHHPHSPLLAVHGGFSSYTQMITSRSTKPPKEVVATFTDDMYSNPVNIWYSLISKSPEDHLNE